MKGFRNLADADVAVPAAGFVVVGPNGHGKTSVLEAALYAQVFRSFRAASDRELVTFGADGFHLAVETERTVGQSDGRIVAVGFDARTGQKKITIDGSEPERTADAIGIVRGVVLSPLDVALVAGGPRERRRYLDVMLALTVPGYVDALARYRRALRHRARAGLAELPSWDRMLAERGVLLMDARRAWAARWAARYAELCGAVGERGIPELVYAPNVREPGADAIVAALEKRRLKGGEAARVGVGPHRDELKLLLDGRELRGYGSAGQQRTAALALRLSEAETLAERSRGAVTVCLDDAFAELDEGRSARLAGLIEALAGGGGALGVQILAAVPKVSDLPKALTVLERRTIHEGRIT